MAEPLRGGCLIYILDWTQPVLLNQASTQNDLLICEAHSVLFVGKFHPLFGPVLWVTYGCMSNTLLTTGMGIHGLLVSDD
jgi:hypothetical protein